MCCFEHNSVELDIYANEMKPVSISNLFEDKKKLHPHNVVTTMIQIISSYIFLEN